MGRKGKKKNEYTDNLAYCMGSSNCRYIYNAEDTTRNNLSYLGGICSNIVYTFSTNACILGVIKSKSVMIFTNNRFVYIY